VKYPKPEKEIRAFALKDEQKKSSIYAFGRRMN